METFGGGVAALGGEEDPEEEERGKVGALPPLLEDEENVSLADILCLRDSCLSEQEVWAVCAECVRSLQSISCSPLFYTLCITPDTLAFNAHGNVCFMEQLSDDPEGSFVPPEFDKTGNTFEGHVFSLGATLSAALGYNIEPETEVELGVDTCRLLEQMQEEKPGDRPSPKVILSLAEAKITDTTSRAVCRKLSAIGRRVLSIESVAPFQDEWDKSYHHFMEYKGSRSSSIENHTYDQRMTRHYSSDSYEDDEHLIKQRRRVCNGSFRSGSVDGYQGGPVSLRDVNSYPAQNSSSILKMSQEVRWRRSRSALNRSCSIPDSNNPPVFSTPSHTNLSMMVADLSEIGGEESMMMQWEDHMPKESHKKSAQDEDSGGTEEGFGNAIESVNRISNDTPSHLSTDADPDCTGLNEVVQEKTPVLSTHVDEEIKYSNLGCSNHMTKSMLCLKEESQDEWIPLRELLSHCTRPLSVNELWALCYTCLSTLQTYSDFPAYLCLDSVYVGCDGELLFLLPKNTGSSDVFYVAPEFQEHGILTEKACIYGVAAILWATAKFHLSPNQKLAMPRKLKRLLLEMAKKTPIERPSIVMAKKTCRDYLSRQGTDAETVWTHLINRLHKASNRINEEEIFPDVGLLKNTATPERKTGFIPLGHDVRLAPLSGPLPQSSSLSVTARLPEAFTSLATHFTPIVVAQEDVEDEESPIPHPRLDSVPSEFGIKNEGLTSDSPQLQENWMHGDQEEDNYSSLSSSTTVLTSSPNTNVQTAYPVSSSQSLPTYPNVACSAGVCNNFLLQQDPHSGRLTLFPVHIAVSQPITGLDLSLPLRADSETDSGTQNSEHDVTRNGESDHQFPASYHKGSKRDMSVNRAHLNITDPPQNTRVLSSVQQNQPILQQVVGLIREEFAFDSYLENGPEELEMGEYILSLTNLHFETFCRAIVEKFSNLHWDKDLLGLLHCLVNQDPSFLVSVEDPSSELEERPLTSLPDAKRCERERGGNRERSQLDHNANKCHAPEEKEQKTSRQQNQEETKDKQRHVRTDRKGEGNTAHEIRGLQKETQLIKFKEIHLNDSAVLSGPSADMESSSCPVDGAEVCVCSDESLCQHSELGESTDTQLALDCSDTEMDDSDSVISDRTVSSCSGIQGLLCRPSWALALYGEDFFSQEVVEYAYKLGGHTDSPSLEDKSQELYQQLMIESRNLKKTRNFYHKLIQQERKNKGSEARTMLSKLRAQFDELRTKVEFLDSVRQYLQVLFIDQWGLPLSLLPSLASSGSSTIDLRATEDPTILSLVCEQRRTRGCCPLLAGTPKGLMAYLYSRNALMEGYIHHFLYTYRYFCSPEEFLHFLMDKFNSSVVASKDFSTDSAKVYHRTLDLLEYWIEDSRSVDFTSNSRLQPVLDNFLTSEVAPVDSRGESLLTMLQNSPKKRRGCRVSYRGESPVSGWEDLDVQSVQSFCRKSSVDDSAKKSFQWRVSRVVEPQVNQPKEKVYSIASALPRPCYSSLLSQITKVSVRNEERVAFSQTEHSSLNTAQQLTLLQQEIFQGCHPVHFLNSRAQGVKEKAVSISKCSSSEAPPLEGSSLFVGDEPGRDGPLQHFLRYAESISNWVSAEIVITDSVKVQTALLGRFLSIAKHCYEARNFATAMQILGGLENVIVRQLPAWKQLSAKITDVLEEIRAVQVFLKSDSLCLMEGERGRRQPTLPDAHILAMHIQQLEIGAFTLTNGAYKWPKLRSIARVVSQVHAFQDHMYTYTADLELQSYLQARINRLGACDVSLLAADNDANFNQPAAERHTRRIQDTLRRVKASFQ